MRDGKEMRRGIRSKEIVTDVENEYVVFYMYCILLLLPSGCRKHAAPDAKMRIKSMECK